ncbi:MAG: segregation/condensation protein A [Candidatus Woesearchaeota archaeon]
MQDQLLDMLLKKDEITWQDLIYDLVKSEKMNPWDIDVSILSKKYLETIRKIQEINFFISGRVILAAAILLKIKSQKLLSEGIRDFDASLFYSPEEDQELIEQLNEEEQQILVHPKLTIKTPLTRKRKVLLQDLVQALEKALEVDTRRKKRNIIYRDIPQGIKIPDRKIDIGEKIKSLYEKITTLFKTGNKLTFTTLIPSQKKEDKVATFIPLLHLETQNKINMEQQIPFGEIQIQLIK